MRISVEQWFIVIHISICLLSLCGSIDHRTICMSKSWTYHDVEKHFLSSSNLFFMFGITIHRPFLNENNQTYADANVFIIAICRKNSSDCISQGGSLPSEYKLKFSIGDVLYNDQNSKINRQWHRTKIVNYDFLYEPFNSYSWYDNPNNEQGSIWKNFIMNSKHIHSIFFQKQWNLSLYFFF